MSDGKSFIFKTQQNLVLLTGLKAFDVAELAVQLRGIPDSSLYFHTHYFLLRHQYMVPQPPNDFAYWVADVLNETRLGEKLMAIDTVRFPSFSDLRSELVNAIDSFLAKNPPLRRAALGEEFHFMKSVHFVFPTLYQASNLSEFLYCLRKVSYHSLYFHMFEGRLRTDHGKNDFSQWLEAQGEPELAKKIENLDPYAYTMGALRSRMISLIEKRISGKVPHAAAV